MINQSQAIRSFVDNKLADLVQWMRVDVNAASNGDRGSAILPIAGRNIKIAVESAYVHAPLGEIVMTDQHDGHEIRGPKSDATWQAIEAHIRRIAGEAQIVGGPVPIDTWGPSPTPETLRPLPTYVDARKPYLGQGVIFCVEKGSPVAGMWELAAMVTRVVDSYTVCLTVFPPSGEPFWRDNIQRRHDGLQWSCWDFPVSEVKYLPPADVHAVADPNGIVPRVMEDYAPEVLPVKRGPGRPRKVA